MISSMACEQEVIGLHDFFQVWLEGSVPPTDAVFDRFFLATSPAFTLISPDGQAAGREATAAWIRAAYGTRRGFRLWTDEHCLRAAGVDWALVTYREWQTHAGVTTLRLSSALLVADACAPQGLSWLHVHESWVNSPAI